MFLFHLTPDVINGSLRVLKGFHWLNNHLYLSWINTFAPRSCREDEEEGTSFMMHDRVEVHLRNLTPHIRTRVLYVGMIVGS